jgi:hypothetical protein
MFCENWNIHQICISAPICQFCDFVRRLHANVAPTISSDSGKKLISIVSFSGGFFSENLAAVSCAVTSCRALCATFLCRLVTKQTQGAPFYAPCSGCDPCARARSLAERWWKSRQARELCWKSEAKHILRRVSCMASETEPKREREMMFSLPLTPQKQLMLARGEKIPHNSPWNFHTRAFKKCTETINGRLNFLVAQEMKF